MRVLLSVLMTALAGFPCQGRAEQFPGDAWQSGYVPSTRPKSPGATSDRLAPLANTKRFVVRQPAAEPNLSAVDTMIAEQLRAAPLSEERAAALWSYFADQNNTAMISLPIVKALITASATPDAREAMWADLAGLAREYARGHRWQERDQSLLGIFERHRRELLPLLTELQETEPSTGAMIQLMLTSRIFGSEVTASVAAVSERIPAAVARYIENEHGFSRKAYWEPTAFANMLRWRNLRLLPGAPKAPATLAAYDAAWETFAAMFNSLQALDTDYRDGFLRGLGPVELFHAATAGEKELYRVGTSGYRDVLHKAVMRGITDAGSFEAFSERAIPRQFGTDATERMAKRRMAFLRVASYFDLIEPVLETVRDQDRFTDDLIAALDDPHEFEQNGPVVMDVLTAQSNQARALAFKQTLLDRLHDRYRTADSAARRTAYGSMLSVYQTVTGDRRDIAIDTQFALDGTVFHIPFDRLFSTDGQGGVIHRMFMRMDRDDDAYSTYQTFRDLMKSLDASQREDKDFDVFTIAGPDRKIEVYANKPTSRGASEGIAAIAQALRGHRIETVIGRGHTAIIAPLQDDAKRVLGDRIKDVAAVIVGSCGGDASVRDLIATFGYKPFVTTKSTGRQVINNAIIKSYIAALMSLTPHEKLPFAEMLQQATARFARAGGDDDLRRDASLYQANRATVLTAVLYDAGIAQQPERVQHAASDTKPHK